MPYKDKEKYREYQRTYQRDVYYVKNREKINILSNKYHEEHRDELNKKDRIRYSNNREKLINKTKKYTEEHKEERLEYGRKYYEKNKDYYKERYINNKDEIIKKQKEYNLKHPHMAAIYRKKRSNIDINFRLYITLGRRIRRAIKNNIKKFRSFNIIGCSIEFLKEHLQKTAIDNGYTDFNINNYSGKEYHIDHIIPCAAFNLKCGYHQRLCFHWTNLQILDAHFNISKSNKFNIAA